MMIDALGQLEHGVDPLSILFLVILPNFAVHIPVVHDSLIPVYACIVCVNVHDLDGTV